MLPCLGVQLSQKIRRFQLKASDLQRYARYRPPPEDLAVFEPRATEAKDGPPELGRNRRTVAIVEI